MPDPSVEHAPTNLLGSAPKQRATMPRRRLPSAEIPRHNACGCGRPKAHSPADGRARILLPPDFPVADNGVPFDRTPIAAQRLLRACRRGWWSLR